MRLFINNHYFISVLTKGNNIYNCQVMELTHGIGMYPATINEDQEDVVSCIVSDIFFENQLVATSLTEVFEFHANLVKEVYSLEITS